MPSIHDDFGAMPRKLLPIIYVIDTSGSMSGDRIAAVNEAMRDTVEVLKDVSANNPSAEIKIGVLKFATNAEWVTKNGLIYMNDFFWNDLEAGGLTDLGAALSEISAKLSRSAFLSSDVGFKAPVIIFLSDGAPTDDWQLALSKTLASNKWFKIATKIALAVGDMADKQVLSVLAGRPDGTPNPEAVIPVTDMDALRTLIRVVSVTASQIGSMSRTESDITDEVIKKVKSEIPGTDESSTDPDPGWDIDDIFGEGW